MNESDRDKTKKDSEVKNFKVLFSTEEIKNNINAPSKTSVNSENSKELIQQAFKFHKQGNILEATKYYQQIINQGCNDYRVFSNYGAILRGIGKLKDAELSTRKAIEIKPDFVEAHSTLEKILSTLGKSEDARLCSEKIMSLRSWSILGSYSFNREMK